MWLTGFDATCLHTMYVDKPMRGHGLKQAIARKQLAALPFADKIKLLEQLRDHARQRSRRN